MTKQTNKQKHNLQKRTHFIDVECLRFSAKFQKQIVGHFFKYREKRWPANEDVALADGRTPNSPIQCEHFH